jgi:hypothetical protein
VTGKYKGVDTATSNVYGGVSTWVRTQGASNNNLWEAMTVSHEGRVGLSNVLPSYTLHLGKDSAFKPGTSTWTTSSDQRLKENIVLANVATCYSNIKAIPLKYYKWRDSVFSAEEIRDRHKLGWIAQDVEAVFPKAVGSADMLGYSDCKTLDSDQLVATLYGAVQHLQAMVEALIAASNV